MQTDVSQDNDISQFIKLESMVIDTIWNGSWLTASGVHKTV